MSVSVSVCVCVCVCVCVRGGDWREQLGAVVVVLGSQTKVLKKWVQIITLAVVCVCVFCVCMCIICPMLTSSIVIL